jgi:hypothetical protein
MTADYNDPSPLRYQSCTMPRNGRATLASPTGPKSGTRVRSSCCSRLSWRLCLLGTQTTRHRGSRSEPNMVASSRAASMDEKLRDCSSSLVRVWLCVVSCQSAWLLKNEGQLAKCAWILRKPAFTSHRLVLRSEGCQLRWTPFPHEGAYFDPRALWISFACTRSVFLLTVS